MSDSAEGGRRPAAGEAATGRRAARADDVMGAFLALSARLDRIETELESAQAVAATMRQLRAELSELRLELRSQARIWMSRVEAHAPARAKHPPTAEPPPPGKDLPAPPGDEPAPEKLPERHSEGAGGLPAPLAEAGRGPDAGRGPGLLPTTPGSRDAGLTASPPPPGASGVAASSYGDRIATEEPQVEPTNGAAEDVESDGAPEQIPEVSAPEAVEQRRTPIDEVLEREFSVYAPPPPIAEPPWAESPGAGAGDGVHGERSVPQSE
ncbi:MAG: hypothetical protein ACRD0B_03135 [Acidimicrobiales bacterium]